MVSERFIPAEGIKTSHTLKDLQASGTTSFGLEATGDSGWLIL